MYSQEPKIHSLSEYYVHVPSVLAKKIYLYPISTGDFIYEPNYSISRQNYDSFLIMYIKKGSCYLETTDTNFRADAGTFVLLDCYLPHKYGSPRNWEALWIHFDGPLARTYITEIVSQYGHVLTPQNAAALTSYMEQIFTSFQQALPMNEAKLSYHLTKILDGFLSMQQNQSAILHNLKIADTISYINEHFQEQISLEKLAKKTGVSLFHFSRIFKKETGFTPHQYLINIRISAARFMLKSSDMSIKAIAFNTGFQSESNFCFTFKKWEKMTPSQYRFDINKS